VHAFERARSFAVILAGAVLAGALLASPALAEDNPATITVSGQAIVTFAPDRAQVEAGVVTFNASAAEAAAENARAAAKVIAAAKAVGIDPADIRTAQFQVNPRYAEFRQNQPPTVPTIAGYEVVNEIAVIIRDIAKTGAVLDALLSSGANRAGSIQFIVSDLDTKLDGARALAVKDATRKAKLYAESAGVKLGRILSIDETGGQRPRPPVAYARKEAFESAPVPIEAGTQSGSAAVTMVFAIDQ